MSKQMPPTVLAFLRLMARIAAVSIALGVAAAEIAIRFPIPAP